MKEKIFTIPVNDAFDSDCECPVCSMYNTLEESAVEYAMGPSYMEDDIRAKTDVLGFCQKHIKQVYDIENRLGFALVMKTHMDRVIYDIKKISEEPVKGKTLFGKGKPSTVSEYTKKLKYSCFVCEKVDNTFARYMDTIMYLYKQDEDFRKKYADSKGFCTTHYGMLMDVAEEKLSGEMYEGFVKETNRIFITNLERVRDDVEWFINKFDHKYANEPWKNAKDSLPRAITKMASLLPEEPKKKAR